MQPPRRIGTRSSAPSTSRTTELLHCTQLRGCLGCSSGLRNAVVLPESIVKEVFAREPSPLKGKATGLGLLTHCVSNHIRVCFSMLHVLLLESSESPTSAQLNKSGALRKRCSSAKHIVVMGLVVNCA